MRRNQLLSSYDGKQLKKKAIYPFFISILQLTFLSCFSPSYSDRVHTALCCNVFLSNVFCSSYPVIALLLSHSFFRGQWFKKPLRVVSDLENVLFAALFRVFQRWNEMEIHCLFSKCMLLNFNVNDSIFF